MPVHISIRVWLRKHNYLWIFQVEGTQGIGFMGDGTKAKKLKGMMWQSRDWQEQKVIAPLRTSGRSGVTSVLKPEHKEDTATDRDTTRNRGVGQGVRNNYVCSLSSCSLICYCLAGNQRVRGHGKCSSQWNRAEEKWRNGFES